MICFSAAAERSAGKLLANSTQEQYAYRFIVELYDTGETTSLVKEIYQFQALYPNSSYLPYVKFIDANLAVELGDHRKAQRIYTELLEGNISHDILAELLLNYAISLNQTGDYATSMHLLQRLDSEVGDPIYSAETAIQRADIYYKQGQYFSAERAYRTALAYYPDNKELQLGLFSCLVNLQKDDEALSMLWNQDPVATTYSQFLTVWLEYLLANERYWDFDVFLQNNDLGLAAQTVNIYDIRIRRALLKGDFTAADSIITVTGTPNSHFLFYKTLIMLSKGNVNMAMSNFQTLVKDPDPDVSVPAYLENLKLLYKSEPLSAITQLSNYIKATVRDVKKAEMYYTLGYFCYHKDDYSEAIKQLSLARQFEMSSELNSRIDMLIAESWFALGRNDMAIDAFNKYLNHYSEGSLKDKALFYIGYINFNSKNYSQAKQSFARLTPESIYYHDALYYQSEIEFYLANYNTALMTYLKLYQQNPGNSAVALRIAQSYYYMGDLEQTEMYIGMLQPTYESSILKGNVLISRKNYSAALDQFSLAESFAIEPLRKAEAQSYRALCLYQMKRFKEASALYLQLSNTKESPDTYLFLSAKSAYAAKDYHQALQLLDSFIDQYPNSQFFFAALGSIANSYYNMGNYQQAVSDWLNILKRFRNNVSFNDAEIGLIKDTLLGVELGIGRLDKLELLDELINLPDTFSSEFIKFELNLILLKTYASGKKWAELIRIAERIRNEYPQRNSDDVAMLMVTGLIELNKYGEADTLLNSIYEQSHSPVTLLKWAELEMLTGSYASALQKYKQAFATNPNGETWVNMLECSSKLQFDEFEDLWLQGAQFEDAQIAASRLRLNQLYHEERYIEAQSLAESLLYNSLSTQDHAQSFLILGLIDYQKQNYNACIASLKRVILLFPEYPIIRKEAIIYMIKAQVSGGAVTEAEMHLSLYARDLDIETLNELNRLVEGRK
jgi:tetratricopeptide (TPR) repeat protein